jgi:AAA15 family ATPase/GTPase
VRLFQDQSTNPNGAQLIFTSHDASLLGNSLGVRPLGRDQIWFTEKSNDGRSRLFPLSDLDPRKEESIERRYLEGRYGGVPIVSRQEFAAVAERILDESRT